MTGGLLVFALPRCGGRRLTELLCAHPALRCFGEPFNPAVPDPTGRRTPSPTLAQVDAVLNGVWAEWRVITHVWDPSGWPFHRHSALNGHVLLCGARVVLLSRRNLLRLTVSAAVADQSSAEPDADSGDEGVRPLDIESVRWQLEQIPASLRTHRRVLYVRDRPALDIAYEDLFGPDLGPAERHDAVEQVFGFFGHSTRDPGVDPDAIRRCLETDLHLDPPEAWRKVPNVEEIDAQLGSDETGWLLSRTAPAT